MSTVIIHKNVVLHGITLAENSEIKSLYVEHLAEDPIFDQSVQKQLSENPENKSD